MPLLSARQTAARMGVKVETVYAYASRGLLRRHAGADGRSSWFDERDVEALARRGRPRRSSRDTSLDLLIETRLTSISVQGVRYRGHPSAALADECSFEQVAELLWLGELPDRHRPWPADPVVPVASGGPSAIRTITAALVPAHDDRTVFGPAEVAAEGRRLLATVVDSLAAAAGSPGRVPGLRLPGGRAVRGATLAGRLWPALSARPPAPGVLPVVNAVLVTMADHELAASTLAVRVAASARAHPAAAVLAGLGTLQGSLHGGATRRARDVLDRAVELGAARAVTLALGDGTAVPGFGHRVYPGIDPRAADLLARLHALGGSRRVLRVVGELAGEVERRTGRHPNVDFALAAVTLAAGLAPDAGETLMAVGRMAGWLAHAAEEYGEAPLRFRPRASYVGV